MYQQSEDREHYPEQQLVPVRGGRYTTVFHGPPGTDVGDLSCDLEPYVEGGQPAVINHSGWLPSQEHVRMLDAGAHIRLSVYQHPIPPLAVSVEAPVCACHDEAMQWDGASEGFYCAGMPTVGSEASPLDQAHEDFTPVEGDEETG